MTKISTVLTTDPENPLATSEAQSSSSIAIGLDVGNGALKLYSGMGEILMESYVYYPPDRFTTGIAGYAEYLSGDRTDLEGKYWVGGIGAYYADSTSISRTVDSKDGKVAQSLQLLLSSLSQFPYRAEYDLKVAASVHDGKIFGGQLRNALQGNHQVKLRGKPCSVNITVVTVLEEGSGVALALYQKHDFSNALLFDLGNGTAICSSFSGVQITHREYSNHSGVEGLIAAIANSELVRKRLKGPGDKHLIRAGIEKNDFSYGNEKGWNFQDAYVAEFPAWFKKGFLPFVKTTETRVPAASCVMAVGGGALLPGMQSALTQKGITVPENPRWVNAKGLYMRALRGTK
jgi:hypothetical protein